MVSLEPRPATLPELLDMSARLYAHRPAMVMRQGLRDDRWTYARLERASHSWAQRLQEGGIQPGERVLVQASGCPELIAAMFGAFRAGVVLVPLDLQSASEMIASVATSTEARGIIAPAGAHPPRGLPLIRLEPVDLANSQPVSHVVRADDLAEIVFTSGTTAQPKGVMLTHGNITANVRAAAVLPHGPSHRLLSLLPISHMLEQTGGVFFPLSSGGSIAFPTSIRSSTLMAAFVERRPTTLVAVPRLLELLLQGILRDVETRGRMSHWNAAQRVATRLPMAARRLLFLPVHQALGGSLRWIFSGGAALDPQLQAAWRGMGITLMQGYGATECAPFVSCQRPVDDSVGSIGRPLPGVETVIADDGELMVRGPNVTRGYWRNPEATAEVLHDHWYATGDLARIDDDGDLHLFGRKREMIALPSGMNVFPVDVDAELHREPDFADAAAVGWSSDGTMAVHAVLVPASDAVDIPRAISAVNGRLASHQRITGWSIWPEAQLPMTSTQKIRRGEIIAWLQGQVIPTSISPVATDSSQVSSLARILATATNRSAGAIRPDMELTAELGLDSLARVELAVAIEQQLGAVISDEAVAQAGTVAELEQLISAIDVETPTAPAASWPFSAAITRLRGIGQQLMLFPLLESICRPRVVEGWENVSQCHGPVLLIANHASHLDASVVLWTLPSELRRLTTVAAAKDYFFSSPWRAVTAQLFLGAFPMARTGPILPSLVQCGRLADRGRSILIFPEGTRSADGSVHDFKAGIGLLERELRLPVIPIGLQGTGEILSKGQILPHPGRMVIRFGWPISRLPGETDQDFADRLRLEVIQLTR